MRRKDGAECLRTGHPDTKGHAWCNLDLRVCTPHGAAGRGGEGEQGVTGLLTSVRMISSDFGAASNRSERDKEDKSRDPSLPTEFAGVRMGARRAHGCGVSDSSAAPRLPPHSLLCGWPSSFGGKDQYWKS